MTAAAIDAKTLLSTLPKEWPEELLTGIQREVTQAGSTIVILDDDPTGTQTITDLPVLTHWSVAALEEELNRQYPAFFILTNSRSMPENEACALAQEIGENLYLAAKRTKNRVIPVSRSDSTLRGHFPAEVDAMAAAMKTSALPYLVVPFFLEGGRYTINDIHYVQEGSRFIPAAHTAFANDAAFGFCQSDLKLWIEEKTGGRIPADQVNSISIDDIRLSGPKKVTALLEKIPAGAACIVNLASYGDMEVFVAGLLEAEKSGKEFLFRTAASFVRTRTGQHHKIRLLSRHQLLTDSHYGGLFIIGSYIEKTGRQVKALLEQTDIQGVEIDVGALLSPSSRPREISRVISVATAYLKQGEDVAMYTSRKLITGGDAVSSLNIGQTVSDSIIEMVKAIEIQPRYLVAKGGITSSDVATEGLGVKRAMVLGQPLPGVPAWKLGPESKYPGMSYVVFPGNVGEDDALVQLKNKLCKQ